jgi:adenosine kinase
MRTLICGSIAYDTIMVFHDQFKKHILPDQLHILNVAFLVPDMRREFGGCAGNIAYNLKLLGGEPVIMATVGADAGPYLERMRSLELSTEHVTEVGAGYTAQAFITTDLDDNQITAFHPGAMTLSHHNRVTAARDIGLGIVAPDGREGMLQHAAEFKAAGIPFIFDPGQGLPMFNGEELLALINQASYCTVNDYEAQMLCERTGLGLEAVAQRVKALIVTRGAEGAHLYQAGDRIDVPAVTAEALVDPTGCGDAFRGGLLYGLGAGWDLVRSVRLASLMGAIKIASRGGQNHSLTREEIATRYARAWGERPW